MVALVVISVRLFQKQDTSKFIKFSNYFLVGLGVLALSNYTYFSPLPRLNYWDSYHYYINSKYFPELGYTKLYACTVVAESESPDPSIRGGAYRVVKDLSAATADVFVHSSIYLSNPSFCKASFSSPRWDAFKKDLDFFYSKFAGTNNDWRRVTTDHGFNAPPMWTLAGEFINDIAPLSDSTLRVIALIDVGFLIGSVALLCWAFGVPTAAFAVIIGTAAMPTVWAFIGGSILRFDWFILAILSVCAMKRKYYFLAGAALGYSVALRIFPAIFMVGPFVGMLYAIIRKNFDLKVAYGKFFVGTTILLAILITASATVYGWSSLDSFFYNSKKHSTQVSGNSIGLTKVLTYDFDTSTRGLEEKYAGITRNELYLRYIDAQLDARKKIVPVYIAIVAIVFLLFFIPAVSAANSWQTICLGASFVPFVWTELAAYYYLFGMIIATLFAQNWKVAFPLLGMGILTIAAYLSGLRQEYFILFSAAVCMGSIIIWIQVTPKSLLLYKFIPRVTGRPTELPPNQ